MGSPSQQCCAALLHRLQVERRMQDVFMQSRIATADFRFPVQAGTQHESGTPRAPIIPKRCDTLRCSRLPVMSKQPLLDDGTNGVDDVAAHLEAGLGGGDVSLTPSPSQLLAVIPWGALSAMSAHVGPETDQHVEASRALSG